MALYCFKCQDCDEYTETIVSARQICDPATHPHCPKCGVAMKRDFRSELVGLDRGSKAKGHYPYYAENLGSTPVLVESPQHLKRMMKEQGIRQIEPSADIRARNRDRRRRFF
jgi:predicted nucleic acid-binding Zn ribbon protein